MEFDFSEMSLYEAIEAYKIFRAQNPKEEPKPKRVLPPWWDAECQLMAALRRSAIRKYQRNMSEDNFILYKHMVKYARRVLKERKKAYYFIDMVGYSMDGPARDKVMRLMAEKDRVESEIRAQTAILESNNITMTDDLVDDQGYPRSDIDVYKVRHARHQIICLQNDHKALMRRIEQGLSEVHSDFVGPNGEGPSVLASAPAAGSTNGHANGHTNGHTNGHGSVAEDLDVSWPGFATVGRVQEGSPADLAGLRQHDEILQFGSISRNNFRELPQIFHVVASSVGQNVCVQIRRDHRVIQLMVVPRQWEQPGLLGCHINRR